MEWLNLLVSILSGLAVTIPLVIQLAKYIQTATKEKNWAALMKLVMGWMTEAEKLYDKGSDKKEWVMAMVVENANLINYPLDEEALERIGATIDEVCTTSRSLNN